MTAVPDPMTLREHSDHLTMAATLINLTSEYLTATDDTATELVTEDALNSFITLIVTMGPDTAGGVLAIFGSLVTQTADQEIVQSWFTHQGEQIKAALASE